jgi:hypothetical protein
MAWLRLAAHPATARRAFLTALIVGMVLIVINHGSAIISHQLTRARLIQMGLTVLVPYVVSTVSSVATRRELGADKSEKKIPNARDATRRSCEAPRSDGSMRFFRMQQFWELAEGLPIKTVRLNELEGFDEVCWFGGSMNVRPTCRAIAQHARDIFEADLSYPIILSPTGEVLDGWHRICKAFLQGIEELEAVQLTTMPTYRWRVLPTGEEVAILEESDGRP